MCHITYTYSPNRRFFFSDNTALSFKGRSLKEASVIDDLFGFLFKDSNVIQKNIDLSSLVLTLFECD